VGSRIRFFSGVFPWGGPWGYRHGGWGPGRGSPPPRRWVPVRSSPAAPTPPALRAGGIPIRFSGTPTLPALRAPPPPPPGGRGSVCDTQWEAVPGIVLAAIFRKGRRGRTAPGAGSSPGSPRTLDRGGYRHGREGQSWRYPVGSRARGAALTSVSRKGRKNRPGRTG